MVAVGSITGKIIDGVMWWTRAGNPWRDLPSCYGNWKTVNNRHRCWSGDGTRLTVLDELRADCDLVNDGEFMVSVDSTVIRAHHHAAGSRHLPPGTLATGRSTAGRWCCSGSPGYARVKRPNKLFGSTHLSHSQPPLMSRFAPMQVDADQHG